MVSFKPKFPFCKFVLFLLFPTHDVQWWFWNLKPVPKNSFPFRVNSIPAPNPPDEAGFGSLFGRFVTGKFLFSLEVLISSVSPIEPYPKTHIRHDLFFCLTRILSL